MISWFDTLRDLPRLREIGRVLLRHGFGHVAQRLRLPGVRWWRRRQPPLMRSRFHSPSVSG